MCCQKTGRRVDPVQRSNVTGVPDGALQVFHRLVMSVEVVVDRAKGAVRRGKPLLVLDFRADVNREICRVQRSEVVTATCKRETQHPQRGTLARTPPYFPGHLEGGFAVGRALQRRGSVHDHRVGLVENTAHGHDGEAGRNGEAVVSFAK